MPCNSGQVEAEGDLALEPGFHRVPVGGDHVNRIGATQRGHVQVGKFGVELLALEILLAHVGSHCAGE